MLLFEWDEEKNRANKEKHGIWFEEAKTVFEDDHAEEFYDENHSDNEDRFILVGKSFFGNVLLVVHCFRRDDDVIRIISARKLTPNERKVYGR